MGSKREYKERLNKERVYREVASNPGDLVTIQERLLKHKVADSRTKIRNAINALVEEGRLVINGKQVYPNPSEIKRGRFVQKGANGYIIFDGDSHQYFIDKSDTKDVKNNSLVEVSFYTKLTKQGEQKFPFITGLAKEEQNTITNFQSENDDVVYGRVMKSGHDDLVFIANDKRRYKKPITIINDKKSLAKYQDKICTMKIIYEENGLSQASGLLLDIKGEAGNPIAEYDAIAESHGAIMSYDDPKVRAEIEKIPTEVDLSQYNLCSEQDFLENKNDGKETIVDLRNLQFTTTDPATCKDMDDAIYSTFDKDGNIVVYTAVANVTKYVKLNSEIGHRYIQAGFTTYAPNKAYNILPPELSTNICSLNPNVDRLAFVVKTTIDAKSGEPIESTIMDAVIQSKEKYSYEEAQEIVDSHPEITKTNLVKKVVSGEELSKEEQVIMNKFASDALWKGLKRRNLIEFDTDNEYDVTLSDDMSDIVDINKQAHCPYHKVIESFMVTANEATAEYALRNNIPNIYRVHDLPNEDKVEKAYEFFGYLNIPFEGDLSPMGIKNIIESVKGSDKEKVVNNFLVRLQSKAKYCNTTNPADLSMVGKPSRAKRTKQNEEKGAGVTFSHIETKRTMLDDELAKIKTTISHFGLQSQHYSHTTSPIRRVPDYVTHYNILAHLKGKKMLEEDMVRDIALWANQMQDAVDSAEHEIDDLNSAIYCTHLIGQKMKGRICAFRKLAEKGTVSPEEVIVVVENEDKGVKVDLPLLEVLAYKGGNTKNIAISPSGCAVVNKQSGAPILTLCQELTFKITNSNRITRQVSGSMNLSVENDKDNTSEIGVYNMTGFAGISPAGQKSRKKERMHQNRDYRKREVDDREELAKSHASYGLKFKNQIDYSDFTEDMENEEAYNANKNQCKAHRQRKRKQKENRKLNELYDYEDERYDS